MSPDAYQHAAEHLEKPLLWSLAFHLFLFGSLVLSTFQSHRGETWGGLGGGAVTVGLVRNLAGVPLPRPDVITPSRVVDETKGLYQSEAKPKEQETPAQPIPEFERNKPPRYSTRRSRVLENEAQPPPGAIPYGQGGAPAMPYTQFTMGAGAAAGLGFSGPGGDFAGRFAWYVEAVRNRISSNWLQSTVDPSVRMAPRAVLTFQVMRDGSVVNIELLRSSGNASVDNSARRAILSSSPMPRLPEQYAGSHVTVEFWFDFRR
jgi:protein TonB